MRFREILNERYVNVTSKEGMLELLPQVFELIQIAYGPVGGHVNYQIPNDLLDSSFWKLVRFNRKLVAVIIYKDKNGRKLVGVGHDGSTVGKQSIKHIIVEDIRLKRMWAEVSGGFANYCIRLGVPPVPNDQAEILIQKEILEKDGKFKYKRLLAGHVHQKMIVGYPNGYAFEIDQVPLDQTVFEE